ncbi:shikimate kinase [Brevibacillus choshinensis]|uniref:Shikimate kinase n=1 Tax=Brevibacillus choshinensis TaxID=54911 RepID=A0ABR5NC59_BRECH|nr:shikimate kinase [Brevibacillus choshinensis]KQL49138.1 shikimate kinase [Brevibacillus choshinensis]
MKNVVLVGFMGTGKTTVGAALSEALGIVQKDLDEVIVAKEGCSIPTLFAERGEAYFRDVESKYLDELLDEGSQILTTGGGVVLRQQNVESMLQKGIVVALSTSEEELIKRLENDTGRPLLAGGVAERVRTLLQQRAGAYDFAPIQIDTTGKSLEAIVAEITNHLTETEEFGEH